jgi:hypothetical protein
MVRVHSGLPFIGILWSVIPTILVGSCIGADLANAKTRDSLPSPPPPLFKLGYYGHP